MVATPALRPAQVLEWTRCRSGPARSTVRHALGPPRTTFEAGGRAWRRIRPSALSAGPGASTPHTAAMPAQASRHRARWRTASPPACTGRGSRIAGPPAPPRPGRPNRESSRRQRGRVGPRPGARQPARRLSVMRSGRSSRVPAPDGSHGVEPCRSSPADDPPDPEGVRPGLARPRWGTALPWSRPGSRASAVRQPCA